MFSELKIKQQKHVKNLLDGQNTLYLTDVDKDKLWNLYLNSFPEGTNLKYKERREYDCNCCRHFIKQFGNVVAIKDNKIITIWDFDSENEKYQPVIDALAKYVKSVPIVDVFITEELKFGVDKNIQLTENNDTIIWHHFHVELPKRFKSLSEDTVNTVKSQLRDIKKVFKRSLEEINKDALESVLDLISQESIDKGDIYESSIKDFLKLHNQYYELQEDAKDLFLWEKSVKYGPGVCKIRGHAIGTLLIDISEGTELNVAVAKYDHKVCGPNFMRSKPVYSEKQIKELKKTIIASGYGDSIGRKFATIEDIPIEKTLFVNRDVERIINGDIFSNMENKATVNPKSFNKLEEVSIKDFIKSILPRLKNIELYVENRHSSNLVSLIGPKIKGSKNILKWDNPISWAYTKNMTDSMKEQVKEAGGYVDGPMRFSFWWNKWLYNPDDYDAHCIEPNKNHIYYHTKYPYIHLSTGRLDVDIVNPKKNITAIENITWLDRNRMQQGIYKFYIENFEHRGGKDGFEAEFECEGNIYSYKYENGLRHKQKVDVLTVEWFRDGRYKILKSMDGTSSSKEIWGMKTNKFHQVSIMCLSPNFWNERREVGHKHYFFIINGCRSDETPNGFYNEFLKSELVRNHKRALECLGSESKVSPADSQASGLGFSSTKRDSVILKVEGYVSRILKVIF